MVPDNAVIEDIVHALSMMCRGNGHLRFIQSDYIALTVQEVIARGYQTGTVLACYYMMQQKLISLTYPSGKESIARVRSHGK